MVSWLQEENITPKRVKKDATFSLHHEAGPTESKEQIEKKTGKLTKKGFLQQNPGLTH